MLRGMVLHAFFSKILMQVVSTVSCVECSLLFLQLVRSEAR
jgi:hypothetical protein